MFTSGLFTVAGLESMHAQGAPTRSDDRDTCVTFQRIPASAGALACALACAYQRRQGIDQVPMRMGEAPLRSIDVYGRGGSNSGGRSRPAATNGTNAETTAADGSADGLTTAQRRRREKRLAQKKAKE